MAALSQFHGEISGLELRMALCHEQRFWTRLMATVDVVIPCYNYARYLRSGVGSVLSQADVEVRVLVIDDASIDDTPQVAAGLAAADPRVELRRHDVNKGHIQTYNEGLLCWATADYCVLLSADDLLVPGSLSRAVRVMEGDHRIGMVYGHAHEFTSEQGLPSFPPVWRGYNRWSGAQWLRDRFKTAHNVVATPAVVVRTAVQHKVGGYRPELPHAGDLEMWLRIASVSDIAYVKGTPQACYRLHAMSMMTTTYNTHLIDLYQRRDVYRSVVEHQRKHLKCPDALLEIATRKLAREALARACTGYDRNEVEHFCVDELVEFAMTTYPDARSLPEYRALGRRRFLGPLVCNRTQLFVIPRVFRRIERTLWRWRWRRCGV
jgi:glycosyltransferase involved in cell wall biosynthesis